MPQVRANAGTRWVNRSSAATGDYQAGVANPRTSWKAASSAAAPVHTAAMQAAIANNSYAKGVAKSSDAAWQAAATGKGADRFGPGVQAAQSTYETAVAPYTAVIQSTQLPPRGPKGSAANYQRVQAIGQALNAKKKSLLGGFAAPMVLVAVAAVSLAVAVACHAMRPDASGGDGTGKAVSSLNNVTVKGGAHARS